MKKKIFILAMLVMMLCGCSKIKTSTVESAYNISNKIVEYMNNDEIKIDDLNKSEKETFNKFIESSKEENYVINISELGLILDDSYTEEGNNPYIYKDGNDYKIKYSNITWEPYENDYRAVLNLNHKQIVLYKTLFPILYDDTANNSEYTYSYDFYKKFDDKVEFYYKNMGNNGGLTIRFKVKNNKITDIYTIFEDVYAHEEVKESDKADKFAFRLFGGIVLFVGIFVALVFLLRGAYGNR